jgi:hypothetical protein
MINDPENIEKVKESIINSTINIITSNSSFNGTKLKPVQDNLDISFKDIKLSS